MEKVNLFVRDNMPLQTQAAAMTIFGSSLRGAANLRRAMRSGDLQRRSNHLHGAQRRSTGRLMKLPAITRRQSEAPS
jgi:hypothetical protein